MWRSWPAGHQVGGWGGEGGQEGGEEVRGREGKQSLVDDGRESCKGACSGSAHALPCLPPLLPFLFFLSLYPMPPLTK